MVKLRKHIIKKFNEPEYRSRRLRTRHLSPPSFYDQKIDEKLINAGFYHVSQIRGRMLSQSCLVSALVERWDPDTHTFHLPIGEVTVTLQDVAMILGLSSLGVPVTGWTTSSADALKAECRLNFGVEPGDGDIKATSFISIAWIRRVKNSIRLTDDESINKYVKLHNMELFGTTLFCDKSSTHVHSKFLPLLRDVTQINGYSWGSACLAHLNRSLCRATQFNCLDIDGPLALLHVWAWERMPFLAPVLTAPYFPLSRRWVNWVHQDREHRRWTLSHYRQMLDNITDDSFLWTPYDQHRLGPNVVPEDIYTRADMWNAPSPLISFECVEWCPTDRVMRQFGLAQSFPGVPRSLANKHNECLTGPKCKNWRNEHRDLIGEWLNRVPMWVPGHEPPAGVPVHEYITWHNREYKAFIHLSAFEEEQRQHEDEDEPEEQPEQADQAQQECYVPYRSPTPIEIPPRENIQETIIPPHGSTPQPPSFPESSGQQLSSYPQLMYSMTPYLAERMDPQVFNAVYNSVNDFDMGQRNQTMPGRLSVDSHFHASAASAHSAARQSFDSSRSLNVRGIGDDGVRRANTTPGIDLNFNASSIQEDEEAARYTRYRDTTRSNTDDGDEDEDEEEDEEEDYLVTDGGDVDTEASNCAGDASASADAASTPKCAGKGYDLRIEHSRRGPNRFTPSGWSSKSLKQGASGVAKNVSSLFKKKK